MSDAQTAIYGHSEDPIPDKVTITASVAGLIESDDSGWWVAIDPTDLLNQINAVVEMAGQPRIEVPVRAIRPVRLANYMLTFEVSDDATE